MNKKFALFGLCFFLILASLFFASHPDAPSVAAQSGGKTLILYDAASGVLPAGPLLSFATFPPGAAEPAYSNGVTVLDTGISGRDTYAGWTAYGSTTPGFPSLDRTAGFQIHFTLQIEDESHRTHNRSGFSLIVLGKDARGIELAFWENEIWAQSDQSTGGLFHHGEGVIFQTTTGLIDYQLAVTGDVYSLAANGQPILSGPVRDYSAFEGFPDPYQTPNFLFLGDNTSSAQARVRLRFVSITGTEAVTPTATSTGASTSSPLPTASPVTPSSLTPSPSPTPARKAYEFCPTGGFFLVAVIAIPRMLKFTMARPGTGNETTTD